MPDSEPTLRFLEDAGELDALEPLWNALQAHHSEITPNLAGRAPKRELAEAWRLRRKKYTRWIADPDSFYVIAEKGGRPIGYAFVTVGPGYASWATGDRLAELETLSVLPEHRNDGVGAALIDAAWSRLRERGIDDMAITTAKANVDSHRFYERQGFTESFVVYYGKGTG